MLTHLPLQKRYSHTDLFVSNGKWVSQGKNLSMRLEFIVMFLKTLFISCMEHYEVDGVIIKPCFVFPVIKQGL